MHLSKLFVWVALILVGQFSLHSHAQEPKQTEDQQVPAIHGQWSKPVNGIRMMAKFLQPTSPHNELQLLVFIQNCSDKPVSLPNVINPAFDVFRKGSQQFPGDGNLLITVEPLDGQKLPLYQIHRKHLRQLESAQAPLSPNEIRLQAIRLISKAELERAHLQSADQIDNDSVHWPSLSDPNSEGRWKIHLSWRPDQQFPVPEGTATKEERIQVRCPAIWQNIQIDLPSLDFDWYPNDNEEIMQQKMR